MLVVSHEMGDESNRSRFSALSVTPGQKNAFEMHISIWKRKIHQKHELDFTFTVVGR